MRDDAKPDMMFSKAWLDNIAEIQRDREARFNSKMVRELTVGELRSIIRQEIRKAKEDK